MSKKPPAVAILRIPFIGKPGYSIMVNGVQVIYGNANQFGMCDAQLVAEQLALAICGKGGGAVEVDVPMGFMREMPDDYESDEKPGEWNYDDLHAWFTLVWVPANQNAVQNPLA